MDLNALRDEIDSLDKEILKAFEKRMELCRNVALYKKANGMQIFQSQREKEIIKRVRAESPEELKGATTALFTEIMDISKCLQQQALLKGREFLEPVPLNMSSGGMVGCQGTSGSNSETAARKLFPENEISFYSEFEDVFRAVEKGEIEYGIIPIHNSTAGSVTQNYDLIRKYKKNGVKVTCETCPHYFMLTDELLRTMDADYRMNPPLREESDRLAIINGICDGTIDCIVTDHAPHSEEDKSDFIKAPNGVVGLETSLAAVLTGLYHTGMISLKRISGLMSENPRRALGLSELKIREGMQAELTLIDTEKKWIVDPCSFKSKSSNSAFKNMELKGKAVGVISDGIMQYFEK